MSEVSITVDADGLLDLISYALLGAAVIMLARVAGQQAEAIAGLADDVRYLKDNALTREDEVRPS